MLTNSLIPDGAKEIRDWVFLIIYSDTLTSLKLISSITRFTSSSSVGPSSAKITHRLANSVIEEPSGRTLGTNSIVPGSTTKINVTHFSG